MTAANAETAALRKRIEELAAKCEFAADVLTADANEAGSEVSFERCTASELVHRKIATHLRAILTVTP